VLLRPRGAGTPALERQLMKWLQLHWLSNVRNDLLAGLVVALALIPEAIAFSIIAGVDPKMSLEGLRGSLGLAGLIDRKIALVAHYKDAKYRASLLQSGRIRSGGKLYDSSSLAAKAIVGRPVSGWKFWRYQKGRANWVRLEEIRR
jgi:hypothetical protein